MAARPLGSAVRAVKLRNNNQHTPAGSELLDEVNPAEVAEAVKALGTLPENTAEPSVWRYFNAGREAGGKVTNWLLTVVVVAALIVIGFIDGLALSAAVFVVTGVLGAATYAAGFAVGYVSETVARCWRKEKHPAE